MYFKLEIVFVGVYSK
uniref:Uncharacterized protein n=1 Tax=Rhizophora mucronata TaxID=61149 RepID=A0A2P2QSW3_RHIMU